MFKWLTWEFPKWRRPGWHHWAPSGKNKKIFDDLTASVTSTGNWLVEFWKFATSSLPMSHTGYDWLIWLDNTGCVIHGVIQSQSINIHLKTNWWLSTGLIGNGWKRAVKRSFLETLLWAPRGFFGIFLEDSCERSSTWMVISELWSPMTPTTGFSAFCWRLNCGG